MIGKASFSLRVLGLVLVWAACAARADDLPVIAWQGRTMGSPYTIKIVGTNLEPLQVEALKTEVDQRLKEVNRQMSHYQPDSELSRFNRAPAHAPFKVSSDFARVVRFSLELNRRSSGALDPTLAPVINLWGFGEKTEERAVPSEAEARFRQIPSSRFALLTGDQP
jgi:thiamine biosynthesis lipoprotein